MILQFFSNFLSRVLREQGAANESSTYVSEAVEFIKVLGIDVVEALETTKVEALEAVGRGSKTIYGNKSSRHLLP